MKEGNIKDSKIAFSLILMFGILLTSFSLVFAQENESPEANVSGVTLSVPGGKVRPTANTSRGPGESREPMDVRWDFDSDGNWEIKYSDGKTTAERVTHSYEETGEYEITVEIRSDNGKTDKASYKVEIISCVEVRENYSSVLSRYDANNDVRISMNEMLTALDDFIAGNNVSFKDMCAIAGYMYCSDSLCDNHKDCEVGKVCREGQCKEVEDNLPPVAKANGMTVGTIGSSVNYLARSSYDPEEKEVADVRWDFDKSDNEWDIPYSADINASDRVRTEFFDEGTHNITLEVKDSQGATDRDFILVEVMGCGELSEEYEGVINQYDKDNSRDISTGELFDALDDFLSKEDPSFEELCALSSFTKGCSRVGCTQFCKSKGYKGAVSNACGKVFNPSFCGGENTAPIGPDDGAPCDGEVMSCCCTTSE